jgi:hypothetical protein
MSKSPIIREVAIGDCRLFGFEPRAVIYAFEKDGVTKYVGSTVNAINQRLRAHLRSADEGSDTDVHNWIREVGSVFDVRCLEYVAASDRDEAERRWIAHFGLSNLVNMTDGGLGLSGYRPTEDRNRAIAKRLRKGAHFNCEQCGAQFWRKPRDIKKGHNRFCSRSCYQQWQRGKPKGVRHE